MTLITTTSGPEFRVIRPKVRTSSRVSTELILSDDYNSDHKAMESEDIDRERPMISVNLNEIISQNTSLQKAVQESVSIWIDMYLTFLTGKSDEDAVTFLENAVQKDPELSEVFVKRAIYSLSKPEYRNIDDNLEGIYESFVEVMTEDVYDDLELETLEKTESSRGEENAEIIEERV